MKKNICKIVIIILIGLLFHYTSCKKEPTNCNPIYETTGMDCGLYENPDTGKISFNGKWLNENDSCKYNRLVIVLKFDSQIMNNECPEGEMVFDDKISKIIISSDTEYNNQYKQNDTLNDIIVVKSPSYLELNNFLKQYNDCQDAINLYVNHPPDTVRLHSFIVFYEENDGTIYKNTTIPIYITP